MEQGNHTRICQSCAMPMPTDEMLGTEQNGTASQDYCSYCYQNGAFNGPTQTMEQMVDVCVPFMVKEGMPETQARKIMEETLPLLKRWKA